MGLGKSALEGLEMNQSFWKNKRVFVTGHTGFKGSWLVLWLSEMGADVYGYALKPPTVPSFFKVCQISKLLKKNTLEDIRDWVSLKHAIRSAEPEIVFHLAAQPLVRSSYVSPVETYAVNVMGTLNLLEAVRQTSGIKALVNVTTDKCYENREWEKPYQETEPLGGFDPYSSSKACSELITAAYRSSFLTAAKIQTATVRAGNVFGGGDWAVDRLIPDFLRSIDQGKTFFVRSPDAIRPWQHVLEPLSGYLTLAEKLYTEGSDFAEAWNFGPDPSVDRPVKWIVEYLCRQMPGSVWSSVNTPQPHEAKCLKLDNSKAKKRLGWYPCWDLQTALKHTLAWHEAWKRKKDMFTVSVNQICEYKNTIRSIS